MTSSSSVSSCKEVATGTDGPVGARIRWGKRAAPPVPGVTPFPSLFLCFSAPSHRLPSLVPIWRFEYACESVCVCVDIQRWTYVCVPGGSHPIHPFLFQREAGWKMGEWGGRWSGNWSIVEWWWIEEKEKRAIRDGAHVHLQESWPLVTKIPKYTASKFSSISLHIVNFRFNL